MLDPNFVPPGFEVILYYHNLLEGVRNAYKRCDFLFLFVVVVDGGCLLVIITLISTVDHKINLQLLACVFPVIISVILLQNAYVYVVSPADQIVVKDILLVMRLFQLPESKSCIS